jgi:hypothetical protein
VWQALYEELRGEGFEIIAAAQDSGGEAAAGPYYDEAQVTFTALIDAGHALTVLYGMVNVPTGVWIDEQGRIVRPPEVAYAEPIIFADQAGGHPRYADAVRDWVRKGAESIYVVPLDELRRRLVPPASDRLRADAHFQLGVSMHRLGDESAARRHWEIAQALDPENWNYHRQDWAFRGEEAKALWRRKFDALAGRPYYQPVDLPEPEDPRSP